MQKKMGFLAAIRGKSQSWVALSCDAHLVSSSQGRIRQPCVQSSYWDQTRANIFVTSTILRGKLPTTKLSPIFNLPSTIDNNSQ